MATKNPKAGRGKCPTCSQPVLFRRSPASGRLTYVCDECDSSGFADRDGAADRAWSATIAAAPAPAPGPAPTPAPTPAPAIKAKGAPPAAAGFNLSQL